MKDLDKKRIMELALDAMLKDPRGLDMMKKIMESEGIETEEDFRNFMINNAEIGECSIEDAKRMMKKMDGLELTGKLSEEAEIKKILDENKDNDPRTTYQIEIETIIKCVELVDFISNNSSNDSLKGLKDKAMKESGANNEAELAKWLYELPRGGEYSIFNEVREYLTRKRKLEFEAKIDKKIKRIENNEKAREILTPEKRDELRTILKKVVSENLSPTLDIIKKKSYEKHGIKSDEEFIETVINVMPYEVIKGFEVMEQCKAENADYREYRDRMNKALGREESAFNGAKSRRTKFNAEQIEILKKASKIIESEDNTDVLFTLGAMAYAKGMAIEGTEIVAGEDRLSEYVIFRGNLAKDIVKMAVEQGIIVQDTGEEVQNPEPRDVDDEPVVSINSKYKTVIQ